MTHLGDFEPFAPADDVAPSVPPTHQEGAALQAVRDAALSEGLDLTTDLYNEALDLAHNGHFGAARDRLHVLLGLAPHDGEARLLLAKVLVAGQQWRAALAQVDQAQACGVTTDESLRARIVTNLEREDAAEASAVRTTPARDNDDELRRQKAIVRELRSELAQSMHTVATHGRELKVWQLATIGVAIVAIVVLIAVLASAPSQPTGDLPAVADGTPTELAPAAAAPEADAAPAAALTADSPLGDRVTAAIERLGPDTILGANLEVAPRGSIIELIGSVADHRQLGAVTEAAASVSGVERVVTERVSVDSSTKGTQHTVATGDMLSKLAFRYYGNGNAYQPILDANPSLGGKPNLSLGQVLVIPPAPAE